MADHLDPGAPLIAETGGLNAMVVDTTALPEQAVRDIVASAFQSAGQRCSALRCLYVQDDVAPGVIRMIKGAMDELSVGDPWELSTDAGPVIDLAARDEIVEYIKTARREGRVLHELSVPDDGYFVPPTLISVLGIEALEREVFGPVLHVATFDDGDDLEAVVAAINGTGYGLTFGLHTRIDTRVQEITDGVHAGNIYVNRNQIGAVVGSQPFGGEGLSGTGPKAGGPLYLDRFVQPLPQGEAGSWKEAADVAKLRALLANAAEGEALAHIDLPGPTGEANTLIRRPRGPILCLGPGQLAATAQIAAVESLGGKAVGAGGSVSAETLTGLPDLAGVIWWGEGARPYAQALAARPGPIVPLITAVPDRAHVLHERHLCVDTTAAGGNAALLAG